MISPQDIERLFALGEVCLFVWRMDPGWPITQVSRNVAGLLGIEADELSSGAIAFDDLVHPDDLAMRRAETHRAIASLAESCTHRDYRLRHRDGFWVWVHHVSILQRDAEGKVGSAIGLLIDVSQSAHYAQLLAEQRDRFELVLQGTRLGLWDWNPQTNEVVFDRRWARMLGHELEEIEASLESWQSRVHPDDLQACFADIQAHMAGETEFYENVHRMRHKDGRWLYILDRGRVCDCDADGNVTQFTGTHTDITAQKEAELAAREAAKAKSEFLARMSHEIRTPLHGVLGMLQLLENTGLDAQQTECVSVIRESGDTLLTVINDVLDAAKIDAGAMRIETRRFDLHRTLASVHDLYRERAQAAGLDSDLRIKDRVPRFVDGDPHRLRQVLTNLLSNAFKFTAVGGVELTADATPLDASQLQLVLCVRDTGPGIADVDAVWEPFQQGDASISRRYGGTGLGLGICRRLVELMGGRIDLRTQVGVGTDFTVTLPLAVAADEAAHKTEADRQRADYHGRLPRLRILVAEDNPVNQLVIRGVLGVLGQHVVVVEDGAAAVERCQQERFDVVLMDIHMPRMDGIEACRRIRASLAHQQQPRIIAISADAISPSDDAACYAEFDGAVTKPFKVEQIVHVLRQVETVTG